MMLAWFEFDGAKLNAWDDFDLGRETGLTTENALNELIVKVLSVFVTNMC